MVDKHLSGGVSSIRQGIERRRGHADSRHYIRQTNTTKNTGNSRANVEKSLATDDAISPSQDYVTRRRLYKQLRFTMWTAILIKINCILSVFR